ncbi:MAG: methionine adenosyltransferase [Winkia neuii]|nr:methionine adenosyltransferase [Winkia neuii]KWZ72108.1 methionine adenosyltransferase [Winkia neuii]MDK8099928.1 methionine adenosyltransferase [Winkia neuii]MDU3134939.1 methionine adenosyltransferase [Winkia neuii]
MNRLFTSESVTEGHPDKVCDRISDAILDAVLEQDPDAHLAVETLATTGQVHVAGEITTDAYVEIPQIVRQEVASIGYTSSDVGFDGNSCGVLVSIDQQSPDIQAGVEKSWEVRDDLTGDHDAYDIQGAGDQGLMFGYACNETPDLMPAPIWLAHKLARRLAQVRKENLVEGLRPDGKTQVTVAYEGDKAIGLDAVVVSSQHSPDLSLDKLRPALVETVIEPTLKEVGWKMPKADSIFVNPAGLFTVGGPMGDAGLTGRKIIVDTYGGYARHGGGAFSGKDASKVDRSGAYALRWVAKNIVAAGLASSCEIQVAYAIGKARPVGLYIETFGTASVGEEALEKAVSEVFDLRPAAIIDALDLKKPGFKATSSYGHFGREEFAWEKTNKVEQLRAAL